MTESVGQTNTHTILIVEDNEMNRDVLSRWLKRKGFNIRTAVNGLDGVEIAIKETPDIILMDVDLPDISGWDACRKIRNAKSWAKKIPIIALTAYALTEFANEAEKVDCQAFETKPVDLDKLVKTINSLLQTGAK